MEAGWRDKPATGRNIGELADGIAEDLSDGLRVAVGFECPLFVPVADNPQRLSCAREGEGSRPWSAGAGPAVLAAGLTQCVWVFARVGQKAQIPVRPTFDWRRFDAGEANLLIWEAFVSGASKTGSHADDAQAAASTFCDRYPDGLEPSALRAENPYSLAGAALLRAGLTADLSILSEPCVVIRC